MLDVQYVLKDLSETQPVEIEERRGQVRFMLSNGLFVPEGVAALNSAVRQLLAGGQWFQLWRGEIVSIASPEVRGDCARIYRGPLVPQGARRP